MRRHLARRAEEKLKVALSEHPASPGLCAALEFIAIKNGDYVILNAPQQDALAARFRELGTSECALEYLPEIATPEDIVRGKFIEDDAPREESGRLSWWRSLIRWPLGA